MVFLSASSSVASVFSWLHALLLSQPGFFPSPLVSFFLPLRFPSAVLALVFAVPALPHKDFSVPRLQLCLHGLALFPRTLSRRNLQEPQPIRNVQQEQFLPE